MRNHPRHSAPRMPIPTRRHFLAGTTAAATAAGIAAGLPRDVGGEVEASETRDPRKVTFRETEHVRTFYRLSRF